MIFKSLFWLAKHIADTVDGEIVQLREVQMGILSDLHRALESGQIREEEFDGKEGQILDALDELDAMKKSRGIS